jgi:hypothetical protein
MSNSMEPAFCDAKKNSPPPPPPPRAAKPAAAETTQSDGIDHDLNAVVVVVDIILNVAPSWLLARAGSMILLVVTKAGEAVITLGRTIEYTVVRLVDRSKTQTDSLQRRSLSLQVCHNSILVASFSLSLSLSIYPLSVALFVTVNS